MALRLENQSMKKFINHPENVVEEMLQGLAVLNSGVARLSGHKVMIRADINKIRDQQVAIISGGGSGHEPAHAGYIGEGMLSAGVAGRRIYFSVNYPPSFRDNVGPRGDR